MSDMNQHSINGNLLNRCFEKLFEKNISLAVIIKNKSEFTTFYDLIMTFLENNQDYKWNKKSVRFMLVFDTKSMTIQDIHLSY